MITDENLKILVEMWETPQESVDDEVWWKSSIPHNNSFKGRLLSYEQIIDLIPRKVGETIVFSPKESSDSYWYTQSQRFGDGWSVEIAVWIPEEKRVVNYEIKKSSGNRLNQTEAYSIMAEYAKNRDLKIAGYERELTYY